MPLLAHVEHTFQAVAPGPQSNRTLVFCASARFDGLARRVESPFEITEEFKERDDRLFHRYVLFGRRTKKFAPAGDQQSSLRPIIVSLLALIAPPPPPAHLFAFAHFVCMKTTPYDFSPHPENR